MNEQKISWKRSDLKWRGKQAFKKNYWSAVLVSLVLAIVMATGGSGAATGSAGNAASPDYGVTTYRLGTDINGVTSYVSHVFRSPLAVLFDGKIFHRGKTIQDTPSVQAAVMIIPGGIQIHLIKETADISIGHTEIIGSTVGSHIHGSVYIRARFVLVISGNR